jgi:hypothetical protein
MDKATLVSIDFERGEEVLKVLDDGDLRIKVALWLFSPDHDDWRLVLASPKLDGDGQTHAYALVNQALRNAGYLIERRPLIWIMPMNDPFIRDLRRRFGKSKNVEGMRLGLQTIGKWFVEDAYVYRIS